MSSLKTQTMKMMNKMPMMLSCREFDDFMMAYLNAELPLYQRVKMKFHLIMCSKCRQYVDGYKKTIEAGKSAFNNLNEPVPDDVPEELIQAILKEKTK